MRKHKTALKFDVWMEQIINQYGDDDDQRKIEYVRNFLKEKFGVDEFDNSHIKIEKLHTKSLLWLFFSLLLDFETTKKNPVEQLSKLNGLRDSTSQKMKIPDNIRMQEKYMSLEVKDIFLVEKLTAADVEFIEKFLEKTNVDLESEANSKFVISTNQMIYLIRKIMQDYDIFLGNRGENEE